MQQRGDPKKLNKPQAGRTRRNPHHGQTSKTKDEENILTACRIKKGYIQPREIATGVTDTFSVETRGWKTMGLQL